MDQDVLAGIGAGTLLEITWGPQSDQNVQEPGRHGRRPGALAMLSAKKCPTGVGGAEGTIGGIHIPR